MSIRKKVNLTACLLIVTMLVIGVLSFVNYRSIDRSLNQLSSAAELEGEVAKLEQEFLVLRGDGLAKLLRDRLDTENHIAEEVDALAVELQRLAATDQLGLEASFKKIETDLHEFAVAYKETYELKARRFELNDGQFAPLQASIAEQVNLTVEAANRSGDKTLQAQANNLRNHFSVGDKIASGAIASGDEQATNAAKEAFAKGEVMLSTMSASSNILVKSRATRLSGQLSSMAAMSGDLAGLKGAFENQLTTVLPAITGVIEADLLALVETVLEETRTTAAQAHSASFLAFMVNLVASVFALLLAVGFAWLVGRSLATPLIRLTEVTKRVAGGELDAEVPYLDRSDELGDLADEIDGFRQTALGAEEQLVENTRIKVALDNCTTNVMVAGTDGHIAYMNKSVEAMLKNAEKDLRSEFSGFDASKLIGTNIDIFHKNPAHQRSMLERLNATFQTEISVGGREFGLVANPVLDSRGNRLGSVVEWSDLTEEKRVEREIADLVTAAVAGNLRAQLPLEGKKDFVLRLSEAINNLCSMTASALDDVNEKLLKLSQGDLTVRVTASYEGMFEELKNNLNDTADRLSEIVTEVANGAAEVSNASAEITSGTTDLSQRTEQQASSLEETSASMEEMAATIRQNAENAQQADQLVASANQVATRGGEVVTKAVSAMSRIESSSQKISDIIGVIDEIAFQTNLLALNAAVEAARAGDAGKGFAVVASEVRSLAQRSSEAAKDIKELIVESGGQVTDGVSLVNNTGETLDEIVNSVKKVADIVSEIAAASREQSTGVEEINKAVSQMDEMTQQNSSLVEENAAACRMLQSQAQNMTRRMAFFQTSGTQVAARSKPQAEMEVAGGKLAAVGAGGGSRGGGRYAAPASSGALALQQNLATAIHDDDDWKEF
ncbi:methyl-accepting chemotaxis protein [Roseibium sp.]|uniref:methyl-accepting chemotaxis protein n=1 Tax=Roseibium sp. TaxID=1936156 RepID=UPI003A96DFDA